jgi:hypothetical protein
MLSGRLYFMSYRQFIWGLSNGVVALAISGVFWFGMAAWPSKLSVFLVFVVLIATSFTAIILASVRLRRKSEGFKLSELKHADENLRRRTRKIVLGFRWVNGVQVVLIWCAMSLCYYFRHPELVWPYIALVVSLHFVPLAWLFRVRAYYVTGIAGAGVSLAVILGIGGSGRLEILGSGMGMVVWMSACYLVWNADDIAHQTVGKEKAW